MVMEKICIIGSGNWGSASAKIIGNNVLNLSNVVKNVNMWVYEELVDGKKLTDIINTKHENVKYLPGIKLPKNIIAVPDVVEAAKGATTLVFVTPHQFVEGICKKLKGHVHPSCKAISLIKGVKVDAKGITLISELIKQDLGIEVSTLSGANIANEIALEKFSETTIGSNLKEHAQLFQKLFHTPYFHVRTVSDVHGVEICGALKNVVAIGAGMVDGLGLGSNTKAAIIRIGLMEMLKFAQNYLRNVQDSTFFESCGVGDLMTTCYGGRNRKVAEAFVKTGKSFEILEKEMLNGQKLQGTITALEVYQFLSARKHTGAFPLFTAVYRICYEGLDPNELTANLETVEQIDSMPTFTPHL